MGERRDRELKERERERREKEKQREGRRIEIVTSPPADTKQKGGTNRTPIRLRSRRMMIRATLNLPAIHPVIVREIQAEEILLATLADPPVVRRKRRWRGMWRRGREENRRQRHQEPGRVGEESEVNEMEEERRKREMVAAREQNGRRGEKKRDRRKVPGKARRKRKKKS